MRNGFSGCVDFYNENNYRLCQALDMNPPLNPSNPPRPGVPDEPKKVSSEALLGPRRALVIVHNGREYLLRMTQNGKLILTA
jgi:hemin uptake protein HemP